MRINKKTIQKIVFSVIVLVLMLKLIQMTFVQSVDIAETPKKTFEVSQEEIISSGHEITIKSFDDIESIDWINNSSLLIEGDIDGQMNKYLFDMAAFELRLYKEEDKDIDYGQYTVIREIPDYGVLVTDGMGIGLINGEVYKEIIADITYENVAKYRLSDDLSKLLFYHADKDTIVTYNFERAFYRTIKAPIDEKLLENFERIQISPIGGYVSIEYRDELLQDSFFRIYGADSGKLYAEDVFGMNLSWAEDDSKVCYYYSKEVEALATPTFSGMDFIGKRIGYYDVNDKSIDYIDTIEDDDRMISNIYWSGNAINTITGFISDAIEFKSLLSYDFDNESYNEWILSIDDVASGTQVDLLDDVDAFILLLDLEDNHQVLKIMKHTQEVVDYGDIKSFDTNTDKGLYFFKSGSKFVTVDNNKVTVSNGQSQGYIQLEDNDFMIIPNGDLSQVGVWFLKSNQLRILSSN